VEIPQVLTGDPTNETFAEYLLDATLEIEGRTASRLALGQLSEKSWLKTREL
jgi:hypothetical protein